VTDKEEQLRQLQGQIDHRNAARFLEMADADIEKYEAWAESDNLPNEAKGATAEVVARLAALRTCLEKRVAELSEFAPKKMGKRA
jgi:hypothetical protein